MNSRLELIGVLSFLVVFFVVLGVLLPYSRNPHASILLAQTIVLAGTLCYVCRYVVAAERTAKAAKEQAKATEDQVKVMKDQFEMMGGQFDVMKERFDVEYTPHLRPEVAWDGDKREFVIIRLSNLTGTAAVQPGVYPEWTKSPEGRHEHNAPLVRESDYDPNDPKSCLPPGDNFTKSVIKVGEAWLCRVPMPRGDDSREVKVQWGEAPWEERNTHTWTLKLMEEGTNEWHFVYKAEE